MNISFYRHLPIVYTFIISIELLPSCMAICLRWMDLMVVHRIFISVSIRIVWFRILFIPFIPFFLDLNFDFIIRSPNWLRSTDIFPSHIYLQLNRLWFFFDVWLLLNWRCINHLVCLVNRWHFAAMSISIEKIGAQSSVNWSSKNPELDLGCDWIIQFE